MAKLTARTRLGKYRLIRKLAVGGFGAVFEALDTVEGIHVALKVPRPELITERALEWFRKEARLHAGLDHPNILLLKSADLIDGHFVIAYPLGVESLGERMHRRMGMETVLSLVDQILEGVAHAHGQGVIHCDLKPDNFILFKDGRIRLTDFSISRLARRTVIASGSGTIGYVAPEQAMGRTSFRSDVFSLGLIVWEMLAGELPEWPFRSPLPGEAVLRRKLPAAGLAFLRRALALEPGKRFRDAGEMLAAFHRLRPQIRRRQNLQRRKTGRRSKAGHSQRPTTNWKEVRFRQFRRQFGGALALQHQCQHCDGPVSEAMTGCPWCGRDVKISQAKGFPAECPRCRRGRKADWRFCAWCYGPSFAEVATRSYPDRRYEGRCAGPSCRKPLMPFMRYCPWCRRKVVKPGRITGTTDRCRRCKHAVVRSFWEHCPWCKLELE